MGSDDDLDLIVAEERVRLASALFLAQILSEQGRTSFDATVNVDGRERWTLRCERITGP